MLEILKLWSDHWSPFSFAIIKLIINILDIITLPIYYLIQRPYEQINNSKKIRAIKNNEGDWVRIGKITTNDLLTSEVLTLDVLWKKFYHKYKNKPCLGTRKILKIEEEIQKNGVVFTKYVLDDKYTYITYQEVDEKLNHLMAGFLKIGIKSGDKVGLFAETRAEWLLSALALLNIGSTLVTLYSTLGDDGVVNIFEQCKLKYVITTTKLALKLKQLEPRLNFLKIVIYFSARTNKKFDLHSNTFKFINFSSLENEVLNTELSSSIVKPNPNTTALIMYTSGSTGVPKGVVITHSTFYFCIKSFYFSFFNSLSISQEDTTLSYLPLAHILEFGNEIAMLFMGIKIAYSSPLTLMNTSSAIKAGCKGDIIVAKPSLLPAVPLIMDLFKKAIEAKIEMQNSFNKSLFKYAFSRKKAWTKYGFTTPLMDKIVFKPICKVLGGNCKIIFVGGAPLSYETHEFISNVLCLKVVQGYAATEVTATATLADLDDYSLGHVGAPLFGVKIRLENWEEGGYKVTDKPNPRGEVLISSEGISKGYFENDKENKEAFVVINGNRYWRSGDIGEFNSNGTLSIIDRKKDLVKLQHGEYIALSKIESILKTSAYVDNVWVYAHDLHDFVVAFVIPNKENLQALSTKLFKTNLSLEEMCLDASINQKLLEILIDHCKKSGLLKSEIPKKVKICCDEWTQNNGLVTAVQKLRRKSLTRFYEKDLQHMYF